MNSLIGIKTNWYIKVKKHLHVSKQLGQTLLMDSSDRQLPSPKKFTSTPYFLNLTAFGSEHENGFMDSVMCVCKIKQR